MYTVNSSGELYVNLYFLREEGPFLGIFLIDFRVRAPPISLIGRIQSVFIRSYYVKTK